MSSFLWSIYVKVCVSINGCHGGVDAFKEIMALESKPAIFYETSPADEFFTEATENALVELGAVRGGNDAENDFKPGKYALCNYGAPTYHGL